MKFLLYLQLLLLLHPLAGYACTQAEEFPFLLLGTVVNRDGGQSLALVQYLEQPAMWYEICETIPQGQSITAIDENHITLANAGNLQKLYIGGCDDQSIVHNRLPAQAMQHSVLATDEAERNDEVNSPLQLLEPGQSRTFSPQLAAPTQSVSQAIEEEIMMPGVDPLALEPGQARTFSALPAVPAQLSRQDSDDDMTTGVDPFALEPGQARTFSLLPAVPQ